MTELYRLVYASKNLLQGSDAEVAAGVEQILSASQRNNADAGVTGALMFNAGAFAQVLEGPRKGVEETFERIQCDVRHGDVTVLQCGPTQSRNFANWSMAFVGQSARGQAQFSGLAAESEFDLSRLDGDAVFAMLHELVLEEEGVRAAEVDVLGTGSIEANANPRLDIAQLRVEIAQLRPDVSASQATPKVDDRREAAVAASKPRSLARAEGKRAAVGAADAALHVLKAALASERQRTNELRDEIDMLAVTLAMREDQLDAIEAERDLWAGRAALLAQAMSQEAVAVQDVTGRSVTSDRRQPEEATLYGSTATQAA